MVPVVSAKDLQYYLEHLLFKDSLERDGGKSKIGSMEILRQIQESNEEVKQLSFQPSERPPQACGGHRYYLVLVVALVLAYMFVQMRKNHRLLYARHRELLKLQDRYNRMLDSSAASETPTQAETSAGNEEIAPSAPRKEEPDESVVEVLRQVYARIVRRVDSTDDIYSPDIP